MVNEVNGERGEFDEYAANGKKVKRSKVTFRKKRWVDASFLIIVDACFWGCNLNCVKACS